MAVGVEVTRVWHRLLKRTVTDKLIGEEVRARLDMEITFQVPLAGAFAGRWIEETQRASIDVTGDYKWNVLPSRQPEVVEDKDIENIEDADELKNVDEIGDLEENEDIENAA